MKYFIRVTCKIPGLIQIMASIQILDLKAGLHVIQMFPKYFTMTICTKNVHKFINKGKGGKRSRQMNS